ncbi:MAG: AzlD domain-containing protein [Treponema sp.]|nr:AzlD domain-containing protein [Treponema sp.]
MDGKIWIYIFVAFAVSYLIRVLPLTIFRKPIKNRFVKSFLYYAPYVTLALMTFPAIFESTQVVWSGLVALVAGVVMAYFGAGLPVVAGSCCVIVFLVELIFCR